MEKNNSLLLIFGYFALTFIFFFYKIDSFVKDIFIAPMFFLVPTGIGLIIFCLFDTHKKLLHTFTRLQLALSAAFLGFLTISLVYAELNNRGLLAQAFPILYPVIILLSLIGFYRVREIMEINDSVKSFFKTTIMLLPLFLIVYYFSHIHFSSFPLRDIFMEVHFMKGAIELSKYFILNPETGNSYFPLFQVHFGVMNHFYAYNLFNSHWISLFYLFFFQLLCYYCFYSSFIKDQFILNIAIGLGVIATSPMYNTNGGYLLLLSLVLFSVLVSKNQGRSKALPVILELFALGIFAIVAFLNRQIPFYNQTFLPYLLYYLIFLLLLSCFNLIRLLPTAFVLLLLLIAAPYHKATALYLPVVLLMYAIYFMAFQWDKIKIELLEYSILKKVGRYSSVCAALIILFSLIILKSWPSVGIYFSKQLYSLYTLFGGDGAYSSAGFKGVLAEWARTVPLALHLVFLLLMIEIFIIFRKSPKYLDYLFTEQDLRFLTFSMLSAGMLFIALFIPIPHMYRILFFPALMIFALIGFMLKFYFKKYLHNGEYSPRILLIPIILIIYTIAFKFIYNMPWKNGQIKSYYISMLYPISEIALLAMMLLLIVLLLRWNVSFRHYFFLIILMVAVSLDRFMLITKLYENCYPYSPYASRPPQTISHYSLMELDSAKWLNKYIQSPEFILISDPYTLGIFEAVTGNNGFYTFSNLGLMLKEHEGNMKEAFKGFFPSLKKDERMNDRGILEQLDYKIRNLQVLELLTKDSSKANTKEIKYVINRLRLTFDMRLMKEKIIWIISEKTINWAYGDVGYYPQNRPFDEDYINNYILPYFDILKNAENKVLILRLK